MPEDLKAIGDEMAVQDKRGTSYVYFIVVEDKKVLGIDSNYADGRQRKGVMEYDEPLCDSCEAIAEANGPDIPDECDDCPEDAFVWYRKEEAVPNLYAGVFFTAKACDDHIARNLHHYNGTARSYGMSAYHNEEMIAVMKFLCPNGNLK